MKKLLATLFLLISITSFAQTQYYTTNGKNRLTEDEVKKMLSEQVNKMSKLLSKQLYGSFTIEETVTKKDSIISKIKFAFGDKKKDKIFNSGPLSEYKNKKFPEFDLNTLSEINFNSEQLKGKPTMINFWFTECAPCIDEMPILNKIKETYKDDFILLLSPMKKKKMSRIF